MEILQSRGGITKVFKLLKDKRRVERFVRNWYHNLVLFPNSTKEAFFFSFHGDNKTFTVLCAVPLPVTQRFWQVRDITLQLFHGFSVSWSNKPKQKPARGRVVNFHVGTLATPALINCGSDSFIIETEAIKKLSKTFNKLHHSTPPLTQHFALSDSKYTKC